MVRMMNSAGQDLQLKKYAIAVPEENFGTILNEKKKKTGPHHCF